MLKTKGANNDELTEEMEIDVLGMLVGHEIGAQENCTIVVTKKERPVLVSHKTSAVLRARSLVVSETERVEDEGCQQR